MKYNRSWIFKNAHLYKKSDGLTMSEALKEAWKVAKMVKTVDVKISDETNEFYTFRVRSESEKAVQIVVPVSIGSGGFNAGMWMPKSMLGSVWFFKKKAKELTHQLFERYGKCADIYLHGEKYSYKIA
ncbi:MAG: hypothetical protein LBL00_00030 [Endomicrobium sp.]|jgi:hypothetical protein|nr:hypothetical protein [Endomicrobium sp.]